MAERSSGFGRTDVARCWAGFASLGAGLVHVAVIQEHLDYWVPAGVFFAVIALAQIGWGVAALMRDRAPVPWVVAAATIGVVTLWALSRTTGLPVGPDAGTPEAVGTADVLCMVLHGLVIGGVLIARRGTPAASPATVRPRAGRVLVGLGAGALVMSALTTPALAATEAGEHARPHGSHGEPEGGDH